MVDIGLQFEGVFFCCLDHAAWEEVVQVNFPRMTTGMQLVDQVINVCEAPKSEKDEEEEVSYAGEAEREQHRKRREIKAVLMNDGKQ